MATHVEKANEAAEKLAETTRDSYQTVVDHTVGLQERNVMFAQGIVDDSIKELRHQAESSRAMTQELVERSLDAYMDLAYAPFSYYKEGLQAARKAVR
jgi:hypothetical protein